MKHRFWHLAIILLLLVPVIAACGGTETAATNTPDTSASAATDTPAAVEPTVADATAAPTDSTEPTKMADEPTAEPGAGTITKDTPPAFAAAADAKQYSGTTIKYYGDSVGLGAELDQILSKQFTADTGINVEVIPKPQDATENYATYQRLFQGQSADVDVMMLDVIWPGAFASHLADLGPKLGDAAKLHATGIVQNNTIDGKLIAMPWYGDYGLLYYRTDLLEKYGYTTPPATWTELEEMATKIQAGEQAGNANFAGFVWQGAAYEGLTCDALEWQASSGGGLIVDADGKVSLNNPETIAAFKRAQGWVGTISPEGVTTYKEEDARNIFQAGNAAFMRNWPYAYALGNGPDSSVAGKFAVAPLPHEGSNDSVGTVGGWQLGVSAYSKNQDAAIEFVRYMTSPEVEVYRGVVGGYVPTVLSALENPEVIAAQPYLSKPEVANVMRAARPAAAAGLDYNEVSTFYFQGVNEILQGGDPEVIVPRMAEEISSIIN